MAGEFMQTMIVLLLVLGAVYCYTNFEQSARPQPLHGLLPGEHWAWAFAFWCFVVCIMLIARCGLEAFHG